MSASGLPQQVQLDCKTLADVANRFSPILRFHPQERFFPVLAESWLTHTTEASWSTDTAHQLGDIYPDFNRRGMALCRFVNGDLDVIAGQPVAGDRPLQMTVAADDPYAIGAPALRTVDETTFLDLGGWPPSSNFAAGDTDRLYALYSELSAAMNDQLDWTPLEGQQDLPHAWIPPSVNPTTYCEATWAGRFHEISDSAGQGDFPPGDAALTNYLALTYHYLYAGLETPPDGDTGRWLEGQWESVSLFFRGGGLGKLPDPTVMLPPDFVVVSQNLVQASNYHHRTALAGYTQENNWPMVETLGEHPVLYVSRGTHKFFFTAADAGQPPPSPPPGSDPGTHSDDPHEGGITDILVWGLLVLALAALLFLAALVLGALLLVGIGIVVAAIAAIFAIIALALLILWLISLIDANDTSSGTDVPGSTPNDQASDDGTQGGGAQAPAGSAPPTGGTGGGGGGGGGPSVGLPNTGSPTGEATVSFDVRVIDRISLERPEPTGYPSAELCENPTWWDYSGGWGIRVQGGFGTGWENGTRRVDEFGRSLAYWNGLRLSTVLHGGADRG